MQVIYVRHLLGNASAPNASQFGQSVEPLAQVGLQIAESLSRSVPADARLFLQTAKGQAHAPLGHRVHETAPASFSADRCVLCTEVHKRREKVRGGERIDARRNYTTSKMFMLFICGCYESELCLRVIRGVFILPILLKKMFFKWKQTEQNRDKHT
uniref:Uncharacterized protein n=1 Tax=Hucho hucho TaxID=62062 RepID=A0A4W5KSD0_9TELE